MIYSRWMFSVESVRKNRFFIIFHSESANPFQGERYETFKQAEDAIHRFCMMNNAMVGT